MIDQVLYDYILTNFTFTGDFVFGSAEGSDPPYIVMLKVTDLERPEVLCESQGDSGRALFQFSAYAGGAEQTAATNAAETVVYLEAFKNQMKLLKGNIGTSPDDYHIWENKTGGVRLLGEGASTTGIWGAFFELEIWWRKL